MIKFSSTAMPTLSSMQMLWAYNALDCLVTAEVRKQLLPQLDSNTSQVYALERSLQAPVLEMMLRGIKVDEEERLRRITSLEAQQARLRHILALYGTVCLGEPIKANSPKQLMRLFYDVLKLKPIVKYDKKTKERKPTTNADALEKMAQEGGVVQALVKAILSYREKTKLLGVLRTGVDPDGRMRFGINIGGTETGRFSSSSNAFGGGTNGQNITQEIRSIFIPDEDMLMAEIDLEGADSWGVAVLSQDENYIAANRSRDIHTYVCRDIWPELPWTGDLKKDRAVAEQLFYKHYSYRDFAKKVGHSCNYLITARTLAAALHCTVKMAEEFQSKYFGKFPKIRTYQEQTIRELQTKGFLINPFGRRRHFLKRLWDNDTLREAVAFLPQSITADYINHGLIRVWKANCVQLLMQVHDSLLFQFPKNDLSVLDKVKNLLSQPYPIEGYGDLIIPCEPMVGSNWGKASEHNPNGLKKFS